MWTDSAWVCCAVHSQRKEEVFFEWEAHNVMILNNPILRIVGGAEVVVVADDMWFILV